MNQPVADPVREIVDAKILTPDDWVLRSRKARDILIEKHGYKPSEFREAMSGEDVILCMRPPYPEEWSEVFSRSGRPTGYVDCKRVPAGLIVHNSGPDFQGEMDDDTDPVFVLREVEAWAALSDQDISSMLDGCRAAGAV